MDSHLLADNPSSWGRLGPQLYQLTTAPGRLVQELLLCLFLSYTLEAPNFFFGTTQGYLISVAL